MVPGAHICNLARYHDRVPASAYLRRCQYHECEWFLRICVRRHVHRITGADVPVQPLTGRPAGTYQIANVSNGQCLVQYQSGVKQHACTGSSPPDSTNTEWTLIKVGATECNFPFFVTTTAATSSPTCLQIYPKPRSHPGPVLPLQACDTTQPTQVLTLTFAPLTFRPGARRPSTTRRPSISSSRRTRRQH